MTESNFIGYLLHNLLDSRVPLICKHLLGKKKKKKNEKDQKRNIIRHINC